MSLLKPCLLVSACLLIAGCSKSSDATSDAERSFETPSLGEAAAAESMADAAAADSESTAAADSAATDGKKVPLTPENTKIQFIGTHIVEGGGPDPNPRTGVFKDFKGEAVVAENALESVSVEVQTGSLDCGPEKLTNHLNSPDFFDTREFPTATFRSTKIEAAPEAAEGDVVVTGDLTLHGTTKEISFPAKVSAGADGLTLEASFVLDRSEFAMDQMLDKVNKEVAMTVTISK